MRKSLLVFVAIMACLAQDKPAPTVDELQKQLAFKDQQITWLTKKIEQLESKLVSWQNIFNSDSKMAEADKTLTALERSKPVEPKTKVEGTK